MRAALRPLIRPRSRPFVRLGGVRRYFFLLSIFLSAVNAQTVLVLPFSNLSESQNLDWIGESIAETIRESLPGEGVQALDREIRQEAYHRLSLRSSARLTKASVIRLGQVADADAVVFGSFEAQTNAELTITGNILDLRQMKPGPEAKVSGALEDLGELQLRLAWKVLTGLSAPGAAPSEEQFRQRRRLVRLDAMENYIRGLAATDLDQKHRFFTQASRLDPEFSQPCYQLGRLRLDNRDYRVAAGWFERVSASDPRYREATFFLGLSRYHLGDYRAALAAFQAVLQKIQAPAVWNNAGAAQSRLNLPEAALESFEHALEAEPGNPVYNFNVGYALWRLGEYDEAAESFRAVLDRTPEDSVATTMLGRCLKKAGPREADARVESLERLKSKIEERSLDVPPANGQ